MTRLLVGALLSIAALAAAAGLWRLLRHRQKLLAAGVAAAPLGTLPSGLVVVAGRRSLTGMLGGATATWAMQSVYVAVTWSLGALVIIGLGRWSPARRLRYILLVPLVLWLAFVLLGSTHLLVWEELGVCLPPADLVEYRHGSEPGGDPFCDLPPG
ncbi:MAG: hypothetical protein M3O70_02245 [Actinomycetota bacterium]|nr:hypothetical protein [Actinomycetota bacterium]